MKRTLIRYEAKPERADENEQLIRRVFEELHASHPEGVHYMALRLADGTFVHFVTYDQEDARGALTQLEAFRAFQKGIGDRTVDPPRPSEAAVIGNYRMLSEQ